MSKLELLIEAERRGILPENKKALLTEARNRGLVAPLQSQQPNEIPLSQKTEIPTAENPQGIGEQGAPTDREFVDSHSLKGTLNAFGEFVDNIADRGSQLTRGAYRGLANVAGVVGDGGQAISEAIGIAEPLQDGQVAFGGSEHLKQLIDEVPLPGGGNIGQFQPNDALGRGLSRIGEEVGTTILPTATIAKNADRLSNSANTMIQQIGQAAKTRPIAFAGADVASATGSGTGAAIANEVDPNDAVSELGGQMIGALTPAALAEATRRALVGGDKKREAATQAIKDFEAAGATPTLAEMTGRKGQATAERGLEMLPFANRVITSKFDATQKAIGDKVDKIARQLSKEPSSEFAGRAIERGLIGKGGFTDQVKSKANVLFSKIDDYIPPDSPVSVQNTQALLREITSPIEGAESLSKTAFLSNSTLKQVQQAFTEDTASGQLPYEALKKLRSSIGSKIANATIFDDVNKADLKRMYGALSEDMKQAATAAGKDAEQAFSRANTYYKASLKRIEDDLKPIMGKLEKKGYTPEQVFKTAIQGSNEGSFRLIQLKKSLKPNEWSEVAAGLLNRMGKAVNSKQDDIGQQFSTETFLTNWNKLDQNAKSALFTGTRYAGLKSDLDKIASAASRIRNKGQSLNNPSGTAATLINVASVPTLVGSWSINPMLAAGALGSGVTGISASVLMTRPKFVKWMAKSTEIPAQRAASYLARLTNTFDENDPEYNEAVKGYLEVLARDVGKPPEDENK